MIAMFKNSGYRYPLIFALILHLIILGFLLVKFSRQHQYAQSVKSTNIINATVGAVREPPVVNPTPKIKKVPKPIHKKTITHKSVRANNHSPLPKKIKIHKTSKPKIVKPPAHKKIAPHKSIPVKQSVRANNHSPLPKQITAHKKIVEHKHVKANNHSPLPEQIKANKPKQIQAKQAAIQKAMQQQILAEQRLMAARAQQLQGEVDKYKAQILQAISQYWIAPPNLPQGIMCKLLVHVAPGGTVISVDMLESSGNFALDRSAKTAVLKASPLPVPKNPDLFDNFRVIRLTVKPQGVF